MIVEENQRASKGGKVYMILCNVSNMLSDVYECFNLQGKKVTRNVINMPQ